MNTNYYAVIMAGGIGSRFWPVSTPEYPKQFHDMLGTGETLLQKTFARLNKLIPAENILFLTNEKYTSLILEQIPEINKEQIVPEPEMRNTAPCILYASMKIKKQNPNAVMIVAPSDHWIDNEDQFIHNVQLAFDACEQENHLMTMGIVPTFPNTGYGYIECDTNDTNAIKKVVQFREKPDYETAKKFLEQGNFLWNSGIFIWSVRSILTAFEQHQPQLFELFSAGESTYNTANESVFIQENYTKAENISIDYAVMEKANNVYLLPAEFDWNDLGTWRSLYDKLPKNTNGNAVVNAQLVAENATNNMVHTSPNKIVVLGDLHDYIVVDKDDVLLIYPKSKEQDIKQIVSKIK